MKNFFYRLDFKIHQVLYWTLLFCILSILGLSFLNIILRWLEMAFIWSDPLVRHLVFLSAFVGAAFATGRNQHIRIDLLSRVLESKSPKTKIFIDRVISFITSIIAFVLAKSGYDFAQMEYEFATLAFLDFKSGTLVMIIPFGMILIGLRFLLFTIHGQPMTPSDEIDA